MRPLRSPLAGTAVAALVALLATLTLGGAPALAANRVHVLVIGDSITRFGEPYLAAARPRWVVDGVPGRPVSALPRRLRADLATYGVPQHLVIALGQNPRPGWTKGDYRDAARSVPGTTQVYFVTTYRDPAVFGQEAADQQETYSRWMRQIARNRSNVHLMDWRALVLDGTAVLLDGSHPDEPSRQVWADLVVRTIDEVKASLAASS